MMTPYTVHYGKSDEVLAIRRKSLEAAYQKHPERFTHGSPKPAQLPEAVWINPPQSTKAAEIVLAAKQILKESGQLPVTVRSLMILGQGV